MDDFEGDQRVGELAIREERVLPFHSAIHFSRLITFGSKDSLTSVLEADQSSRLLY